jgi:uncharacterized membrane protein YdbT with pleckstrin-like domain
MACYSFYHVATSLPLPSLLNDALIIAQKVSALVIIVVVVIVIIIIIAVVLLVLAWIDGNGCV